MVHTLKLLEILLVNFVLSGDNALVVAMATLRLEVRERKQAILYGTGMSILLRVWLTLTVGKLLVLPFLQASGGVLLIYVALSLFVTPEPNPAAQTKIPQRLFGAVLLITLADVTMSLDNVVALASVAAGDKQMLIVGLVISISLIMFASAVIASMLARFRILQYAGAALLAFTAGGMIGRDPGVAGWFVSAPYLPWIGALCIVALLTVIRKRIKIF